MFGNLFKSEATKAQEGLEVHAQKVMRFIAENDLHEAWERTRHIIFRNMEIGAYITQNGAFDRNDFYYKSAKEKLIQSAFTSYLLIKVLPKFYEAHLNTLKRKEKTLIVQDDYGVHNYDKWFDELDYFYDNVVKDEIYLWIKENTNQLNTLWLAESVDNNAWGRPVYYQFQLPDQFDRCAKNHIMTAVDKTPEPELPGYNSLLNGHEYEQFVAGEFMKYGADAQVTKGSGDHGLDILVTYKEVRMAVQCKHYQAKVGNKAIQEVFSAKQFYECSLAIVVSNSTFTPHARQAAQKLDVYLYHHEDILLIIDAIDNWHDEPEN